jgi:hypothetical protein
MVLNLTNKLCGLIAFVFLAVLCESLGRCRTADRRSEELGFSSPGEVLLFDGSGGPHYQECDWPFPRFIIPRVAIPAYAVPPSSVVSLPYPHNLV